MTLPKIDVFRFAVGAKDGPSSAFWFIKIERSGDVYASVRSMGKHSKLSLHRDCWCQFGLVGKSKAATQGSNSQQKHYVFRWKRPSTPDGKLLRVASILFPTVTLKNSPPEIPKDGKFRFVFAPPEGEKATEFGIIYSKTRSSDVENCLLAGGWHPMFYEECTTGETITVACRAIPFASCQVTFPPGSQMLGHQDLLAKLNNRETIEASALMVNDPEKDGRIILVELATVKAGWQPPPPMTASSLEATGAESSPADRTTLGPP